MCDFDGQHYTPRIFWSAPAWVNEDRGPLQRTPDLKEAVQAVIDQAAWNENGPIVVKLRNITSGWRKVYSYDGAAAKAASLSVHYNESMISLLRSIQID